MWNVIHMRGSALCMLGVVQKSGSGSGSGRFLSQGFGTDAPCPAPCNHNFRVGSPASALHPAQVEMVPWCRCALSNGYVSIATCLLVQSRCQVKSMEIKQGGWATFLLTS